MTATTTPTTTTPTTHPRPPVTSEILERPDPTVSFGATDEQTMLADAATRFLRDTSPTARVRELMRTDAGFTDDDWQQAVVLGWPAMAVPEAAGGAGYGWAELAAVAQAAGVALTGLPVLSCAVLSVGALRHLHEATGAAVEDAHVDRAAVDGLLARISSGEARATLAHRGGIPGAGPDDAVVSLTGSSASGAAPFVLDGASADVLLVAARTRLGGAGGTNDTGLSLVAVDMAAAREAGTASTTLLPTLDLTRKQADITLDGAEATVLASGPLVREALRAAVRAGAVYVANESVAGAAHVLAESVQYGKDRKQFGRAIGSYQALKHRMADTLKEVESARSTALHAARVLDDGGSEVAVAVPMALSWVGEVYERAAGHHIQNLGGIGFTWEHDAHLWFKRAKTSKLVMGSPKAWRSELADELHL